MEKKKVTALKIERVSRGLKQIDVAVEARIPTQYFSGFETGRLEPDQAQKEAIARVIGIPVKKLFPELEKK